jgi:hypothetical protein
MGGAVVGGFIGLRPLSAAMPEMREETTWTAHALDPDECAPYAYAGYWNKGYGCCYGAFYSIVGVMGKKFGAPYSQFPFHVMEVGKKRISDWGTICGALLGAASAMALFWGRKERDPMVTELFRWYEQTAFPLYDPGEEPWASRARFPPTPAVRALPRFGLLLEFRHGIPADSKTRSERCGRNHRRRGPQGHRDHQRQDRRRFAPTLAAGVPDVLRRMPTARTRKRPSSRGFRSVRPATRARTIPEQVPESP